MKINKERPGLAQFFFKKKLLSGVSVAELVGSVTR